MSCPNYSSLTTPAPNIKDPVEKACTGIGLNLANPVDLKKLIDYWNNLDNSHVDCQTYYYNKINTEDPLTQSTRFSPEGFASVETDFNYLFSSYFGSGWKISVPGESTYSDFQNILISTCSNNPQYQLYGVCQSAAKKLCSTCNSTDITSNVDLLKLCGCQVSTFDESKYSTLPRECDPLCTHEQVVKNIYPDGKVPQCNATVCAINNIAINASDSLIGSSNFMQICPQCTNGCTCFIDVTVDNTLAKIGINDSIQLQQYCGKDAVCLTVDKNGQSIVVDCNVNEIEAKEYPIVIEWWIWIVIIVLLLIVIMVILSYNIFGKTHKKEMVINSTTNRNG